ncbi:MAG TPA: biotin/lipoyl-containing protein [Pseudacidobacterium sp.]|jgi:biotin carboxyl carrier protein|nr:biotin/lipoyl-containing protein [Pseudacidobacterium sp.]
MMLQIEMNGELRRIELVSAETAGLYRITIEDGPEITAEAHLLRPGVLSLKIAGKSYRCVLEENGEASAIHLAGSRIPYRIDDPRSLKSRRSRSGSHAGPKSVVAPMPGRVVRVLVGKGEEVQAHQGIVVIEAMKMQNELKSPKAGKVIDLRAEAGGTVAAGEILAVIE